MCSLRNKVTLAVLASILTSLGVVASAGASVAPGTKVTGTSSDVTFVGTIDGVSITVTCTSFTDIGTVESGDTTEMPVSKPTITGCTDNLRGKDTIKTTGTWELKVNSAGTEVSLVVPKSGATFTSTAYPGCTVIAAPKKAAGIAGKYNSSNGTVTDTHAEIPTSGKGCTTSQNSEETATVKFSPNPGKIPPFAS
jgi:hypothetical protein